MSLLELLKEHLKEWPENAVAYSQDSDGVINVSLRNMAKRTAKPDIFEDEHAVAWVWVDGWAIANDPDYRDVDCRGWCLPTADDARTAIVTREMWEAA